MQLMSVVEWHGALNGALVLMLMMVVVAAVSWTLLLVYESWHSSQAPTLTLHQLQAAFTLTAKEGALLVNRIIIVGCSGSGKTVLSQAVSRHLHLPLVMLDDLYWLPQWRNRSPLQMQRHVLAAINGVSLRYGADDDDSSDDEEEVGETVSETCNSGSHRDQAIHSLSSLLLLRTYRDRGFVIDGNYFRKLNDVTLSRCQLVIHVHLPYLITLRQILSRTLSRYWYRKRVCNGNIENVRSACCDSEAVIPWMMKTHPGFVEKVSSEIQKENKRRAANEHQCEDGPIRVIRIRNDADRRLFLQFVTTLLPTATRS